MTGAVDGALQLLVPLLPGLAVAAAAALLLILGIQVGRRIPRRSIRLLEESLKQIIGGREGGGPELAASDPAARLSALVSELSDTLVDRRRRLEHRAVILGQALEQIAGRGMLVVDRDLRVVTAGEGIARLVDRPPAELEGQPASDLFTAESWKEFLVELLDRDRRYLGVEGRLHVRRGKDLPPLVADVIATDTTLPPDAIALFLEAAEPEDAAQSGGLGFERLQALFQELADGLILVSSGTVRWCNPSAARWLGDDIVGRPLRDVIAAEQLFVVVDRVARAEAGEHVDSVVARVDPERPELRPRELELRPVPIRFGEGAAAAVSLRDRGRERAARRREEVNRARLSAVMQAAADGLIVLQAPDDPAGDWHVALVNERARSLLALSGTVGSGAREDTLRGAIAHLFEDPVALLAFFESSEETPGDEHVETFDMAGESWRACELTSRPIRDAAGRIAGRVVIVRDVTRQRGIERQLREDAETMRRSRDSLRKAYEELAALNRGMQSKADELDSMNDELKQLDDTRAEMIASLAHDLQTPLVTVSGYAQMILEGRLGRINDEQRVGLEKITRNVTHMSELIRNLLAMARAESSPELEAVPVDARAVVEEVVERLRPVAEARGVRVDVAIGEAAPRLVAEREALVQVVENLLGNAIKFNRTDGRVTVRLVASADRSAELSVEDTGVGIPPDERDRVFERFFRGRASAGTQGSGIGLATVRAIVERHGGVVECESRLGAGTTFRVRWPSAAARETGGARNEP